MSEANCQFSSLPGLTNVPFINLMSKAVLQVLYMDTLGALRLLDLLLGHFDACKLNAHTYGYKFIHLVVNKFQNTYSNSSSCTSICKPLYTKELQHKLFEDLQPKEPDSNKKGQQQA